MDFFPINKEQVLSFLFCWRPHTIRSSKNTKFPFLFGGSGRIQNGYAFRCIWSFVYYFKMAEV